MSVNALSSHSLSINHAQLLDSLPHALVAIDNHGEVTWFNPQMSAICPDINTGEKWVAVLQRIGKRGSTDERYLVETTPFQNGCGQLISLTDTTERDKKELEAQYQTLQRVRAMIAHQLRTPLSSALVRVGVAQQQQPSQSLDKIHHSLTIMEQQIEGMLNIFNAGSLPHDDYDSVALMKALSDDINACYPKVDVTSHVKNLNLRIHYPLLLSGIGNLVSNALDASQSAKIQMFTVDHFFVIEVTNFSPENPEALSRLLHTPFATSKAQGSGIGVTVCKRIAEAVGGSLEFKLERHNELTKVTARIVLPQSKESSHGAL